MPTAFTYLAMPHESPSAEMTFGFLSTLESPDHGYFGGYLIISTLGRPLEFHCTSPVRPSRAQEILYGPTLQPYLIGEQISGALLQAAKLTPRLVLTDAVAILTARLQANVPMALLLPATGNGRPAIDVDTNEMGFASSSADAIELCSFDGRFAAGNYELQMPPGFEMEKHTVVALVTQLSQHVDLAEPFGRIHEAIREAQRIGGRTSEAHGQAA
jgi:hypothetical protein